MLLAITNKRTSKAEVLTILMEGFDPAFREELAISAILVEGKWALLISLLCCRCC